MFQALLFDMDGVVVDTEQSVADFWQALARSERFWLNPEQLDEHVYGRHADHTLKALFPMIPAGRYDDVYRLLKENQESLRYSDIAGATKLLQRLDDCDVPMALVTGAHQWKVSAVLEQLGLNTTFEVQVRAEDVQTGKPDPSCYLLAAERLSVDTGRCLVFEDAASGVKSATAAGATCVALGRANRTDQLIQAGAVAVVRDFQDMTYSSDDQVLRVSPTITFPFSVPHRTDR